MKQKQFISLTILLFAMSFQLRAQFHAGSNFIVKGNTPIVIDSVTLQPATDLDLSGNELTISYQHETNNPPPGSSIARVALFASPILYQGTIGLYYDNTELNSNTAAQLSLVYHTGQSGYSTTNLFTTANNNNHVTASTGLQTITLSKLTAVNMGTVLPLQLISFTAEKKEHKTVLTWSTANETNIHHFEVEKASDVKQFEFLTDQQAGKNSYEAIDNTPFKGWNYYRLKIVENNKQTSYSSIVKVYFDERNPITSIYPNPVESTLYVSIQSDSKQKLDYSIFDIQGKRVKQQSLSVSNGDNLFSIDLSNIASGSYILKMNNGFVSDFLKQ